MLCEVDVILCKLCATWPTRAVRHKLRRTLDSAYKYPARPLGVGRAQQPKSAQGESLKNLLDAEMYYRTRTVGK